MEDFGSERSEAKQPAPWQGFTGTLPVVAGDANAPWEMVSVDETVSTSGGVVRVGSKTVTLAPSGHKITPYLGGNSDDLLHLLHINREALQYVNTLIYVSMCSTYVYKIHS